MSLNVGILVSGVLAGTQGQDAVIITERDDQGRASRAEATVPVKFKIGDEFKHFRMRIVTRNPWVIRTLQNQEPRPGEDGKARYAPTLFIGKVIVDKDEETKQRIFSMEVTKAQALGPATLTLAELSQMYMFYWVGAGRVGRDWQSRAMPSGDLALNFSVAVDRQFKPEKITDWLDVAAFRKTAETLEKHMESGKVLGLVGDIRLSQFRSKSSGVDVNKIEVNLDDFTFLSRSSGGGGGASRDLQDDDLEDMMAAERALASQQEKMAQDDSLSEDEASIVERFGGALPTSFDEEDENY